MTRLLAFALMCFTLILGACSTKDKKANDNQDNTRYEAEIDTLEKIDLKGDFNGDGKIETAVLRLIKEGEIQSTPWIYTIVFSDPAIHSFTFNNDVESLPIVINEGPLNKIPGDELSIITQAPMMGMASVHVYSLSEGLWGAALEGILSKIMLPDSLSFDDLVFAKNEKVFYYEYVDNTMGGAEDPDADDREPGFYKNEAKLITTIEPMSNRFLEEEIVGSIDVDGDGAEELMRIVLVRDAEEFAAYRLEFSNPSVKPLALGGGRCKADVFVEGDLDSVRGSELSVMECGTMANYNFISTFSYINNRWKKRIDGIRTRDIMPDNFTREDIIFKENGEVYYYEDEELDTFISTGKKDSMKKVKADLKG